MSDPTERTLADDIKYILLNAGKFPGLTWEQALIKIKKNPGRYSL